MSKCLSRNIAESTFSRLNSLYLNTCLGHSYEVFFYYTCKIGIPVYPLFNECTHCYTCTLYMRISYIFFFSGLPYSYQKKKSWNK